MSRPSSDHIQGLPLMTQISKEKYIIEDCDRLKLQIKNIVSTSLSFPRKKDLKKDLKKDFRKDFQKDFQKDSKKDKNSFENLLPKGNFSNPEKCINQITEDDFRISNSGSNNGVNLAVYRRDLTCPNCLGTYNGLTTTGLSSLYLLYLNPYLGRFCGLCSSGKYFHSGSSSNLYNTGNENALPVSSIQNKGNKSAYSSYNISTILTRLLLLISLVTFSNTPLVYAMSPPPNYSQSHMPDTNFTCTDKATGGYYADPEAFCQMFHVCVRISDEEMKDFRFLCPHDTVFDQQNFICTNWWEIDCERSTRYYNKNDLFKEDEAANVTDYDYENPESPAYYEYVYEYVEPESTTKEQVSLVTIPPDYNDNRHRLKLGKSTQIGLNRQGKSDDVESPSIRSTPLEVMTMKSTSATNQQQPTVTTTAKKSTSTIPPLVDLTTTPTITTHRPSIYLSHQSQVSPVGRTTAGPSVILNSRGRPRTSLESKPKLPYNPDSEDEHLNLDSEDPFSIYDWRRDTTGVTASARTRYEALFGGTSSRGRQNAHVKEDEEVKERNISVKILEKPPDDVPVESAPKSRQRVSSLRKVVEEATTEVSRDAPTDTKHKEFSNFRFYKTAFGRSYSSDDYFGPSSATTSKPFHVSDSAVRPERTASRNTRYSIYA